MSLYSLLREAPGTPLGLQEIEERFDGNIWCASPVRRRSAVCGGV
jgi:hypothetical protein